MLLLTENSVIGIWRGKEPFPFFLIEHALQFMDDWLIPVPYLGHRVLEG